jgi:phosphatidate cytidylyltransferase
VLVRIVAALVGLAVLVPVVVFGGPVAVHVLVPLALTLGAYEYARMAFGDRWRSGLPWTLFIALWAYVGLVYAPGAAALFMSLAMVSTSVRVVLRPDASLEVAYADLGKYLFGMMWLSLLAFLPLVRGLPDGLGWLFFAFGAAWLCDTGAYFAGRFFGRTKLSPLLSPKKTVEGFVGGLVFGVAGLGLIAWTMIGDLSALDVVVLGTLAGTVGVLGDLLESLVKRATGVKDSGSIMPGHGGILDRIDSLMLVAPVVYGYAVLVKGLAP